MKLASLKAGRDGRLVMVSADLTRQAPAADIAPTLQAALDNWAVVEPALREFSEQLNLDKDYGQEFDPSCCAAPLPRAYQWLDGSAYVNHVHLVRQARGAKMPESFWTDPLMYQGGSDDFLGPNEDIVCPDEKFGIDMEAEIGVVVDDTPIGIDPASALEKIRLLVLINDVSLRGLILGELSKGFGFYQSKPATAFGPCAVTPDELGASWVGGKVHLPMLVKMNGDPFGCANAGVDMTFDFGELIAHAARTRRLCAGTIIGSGTISNKLDGGPGKPLSEGGVGYSCIAELRMVETILNGKASTPFLRFGDRVCIEMKDSHGQSIFGRIDQKVARLS